MLCMALVKCKSKAYADYIEMENHLPCSFFCLTHLVTRTQSTRRTKPVMRARLPRAMARLNLSPASRRLCWRQELPDARKRTPPTRHSKHSCSRTVSYYIGLQLKFSPKFYRPWLQKSELSLKLDLKVPEQRTNKSTRY